MAGNLTGLIQSCARLAGVDVRRWRPERTEAGRLVAMLAAHRVDLVLDVGANIGQFALELRGAGYCGRIVSFEPLPDAHAALMKASRTDPLWDVAARAAIGAEDGEGTLHVARNSVSSSMLEMLESHRSAAPDSVFVGAVNVPVRRLDTIGLPYLDDRSVAFLKIDTQGFEDRVLDGASRLMERFAGVALELSLVALYEGQSTYRPLIDRLSAAGFELWAVYPGFADPRSGRMLQVDAVFFGERQAGRGVVASGHVLRRFE